MKRKTEERGSLDGNGLPESKKRALSTEEAVSRFSEGLFDPAKQQKYTDAYAKSSPYVHGLLYLDNCLVSDNIIIIGTTMALSTHSSNHLFFAPSGMRSRSTSPSPRKRPTSIRSFNQEIWPTWMAWTTPLFPSCLQS